MKKTFQVTQEDIDQGAPLECTACPVALAVKRELGYEVFVTTVTIANKWSNESAYLPDSVSLFIGQFDNAYPVAPFEFELDIPDEWSQP